MPASPRSSHFVRRPTIRTTGIAAHLPRWPAWFSLLLRPDFRAHQDEFVGHLRILGNTQNEALNDWGISQPEVSALRVSGAIR